MSADKHSRPKPLNIEEEQFMRVFYENKLREVCSAFYFPNKIQVLTTFFFFLDNGHTINKYEAMINVILFVVHVLQATALIYFKRFYLQWSVMEHHPKHIMYESSTSLSDTSSNALYLCM